MLLIHIQDSYAKALALVEIATFKKASGAPAAQVQKAARLALIAAEDADLGELQGRARILLS